jgi:hypothetical protein
MIISLSAEQAAEKALTGFQSCAIMAGDMRQRLKAPDQARLLQLDLWDPHGGRRSTLPLAPDFHTLAKVYTLAYE